MADAANEPVPTFPQTGATKTKLVSWEMNGVSTGKAVSLPDWSDVKFEAFDDPGIWGSATLVLEGTTDVSGNPEHADYATAPFKTLTDTTETAISATADTDLIQVLQPPLWIRPKTTGGTNTAIKANVLFTKG